MLPLLLDGPYGGEKKLTGGNPRSHPPPQFPLFPLPFQKKNAEHGSVAAAVASASYSSVSVTRASTMFFRACPQSGEYNIDFPLFHYQQLSLPGKVLL